MVDFLLISTTLQKNGVEVKPKFVVRRCKDLMIRGQDFYAIWNEEKGLWSTDESDVIEIVDKALALEREKAEEKYPDKNIHVAWMWDNESGSIDKWHKYCKQQMRDDYVNLDNTLIFSNMECSRDAYASKKLNYPLQEGKYPAWERIISTLYLPEERAKIEWAIGAIVTGESKKLQKFLVFYGESGAGKSTIINIIEKMFDGYVATFDSKALGSASASFALESFKKNPLVAIQHDGDLSRIEDNTRLNSLVSHEKMTVNEKNKAIYENAFNCFLIMGTNKPVKITDGKSGLIRRLIDVSPSGNKIPFSEYTKLIEQVKFELGAIAWHCKEVYLSNPEKYDNYIPTSMLSSSNDFYNFVEDNFRVFDEQDGTTLKAAWAMYKEYCEEAKVPYPCTYRVFKEELKNYFKEFYDNFDDGEKTLNKYYKTFIKSKFLANIKENTNQIIESNDDWLSFDYTESIFDKEMCDCYAQYASTGESQSPMKKWGKVTSKLSSLNTSRLHYVKVPINHIVIDFDIPDENGNKCFEKNKEAASKWPRTYAELSKSGGGIHLHYIYQGDPTKLKRNYDDYIEVKVFSGDSSLRRKLSKCNAEQITCISSGLPLKEDKKMVNFESIKKEEGLRKMIDRNLAKEIHGATKPSIDFINKILEDAYYSGMKYDVTDMRNSVLAFAASSTHQAQYCIKLVNQMKFKSDDISDPEEEKDDGDYVFFDIEVFPNLFLVNYKYAGLDKPIIRLINPKPTDIESLLKFKLIGFNCRDYDNHMLYACYMGYDNEQLYRLSKKLINDDKKISREAKFGEAFNISYTDVFDFAATKQGLKKWEIELSKLKDDELLKSGYSQDEVDIIKAGTHHQELGFDWDLPVPENKWNLVAEYCDNDVIATEATFTYLKGDFTARRILAELADMSVNTKTNDLTARIIFGKDRNPQKQFNYRDLGAISDIDTFVKGFDEFTRFDKAGRAVFPGYKYDEFTGKSTYRGEDPSNGGYVYATPGIYGNVALLDVASLHPSTMILEMLFGKEFTQHFADIKQARIYIKHSEYDKARHMLNGRLAPYLGDESTAKSLAQALKIAINAVYGMTSAKFPNLFKDPRNIDNIVAKRGALFMINLKHEVEKRGFIVVHIKTDSIKIADATPEIIQFVMDYGKLYGYDFEHEATYDRICLVNDAVYIAKDRADGHWTATGTQFQVGYVFKKLFSKEPIEFYDLCETKSVKKGKIYIDMNEGYQDVTFWEKLKDIRSKNIEKLSKKDKKIFDEYSNLSDDQINEYISQGHNYMFIGKIGLFCPMKENSGGGILYRYKDGKYFSVTGTKGYRWLESEVVKNLHLEDQIDLSYYDKLVDDARESIAFFGDFEWFVSDDPYIGPQFNDKGIPLYI